MPALTDDEYLIKYKSGYTTNNLPRCLIINDQGTPWVTEITPGLNGNIFGVDSACSNKNRKAVWKLEARPTGEFIITNAATGHCLYSTAEGKFETGRLGVSPGMMGGSGQDWCYRKTGCVDHPANRRTDYHQKGRRGCREVSDRQQKRRGTLELFKWGPGELCGYPGGYKAWLEQTTYAPSN